MKYAAAYIRVSDDRQDEYSPDSQLKLIRQYAKSNDYIVPDEYVFYDDGISGRSVKKRKAFNSMIGYAKSKEHPFDAILVWKFSRFARNQEESIVYKSMLRKINVTVISVSETIDDSPFAPLIERIIEFMDEYYSTRLSQEVTRGMTEKASRGEAMSVAPFGYDSQAKTFIPNDDAKIVNYIYDSYLSGKGYRAIAQELGTMGIRTKRGNIPDNRFVEYILQNPVYIGKIRWSPECKGSKSRYKGDNSSVMIVDGKHEAIIDTAKFEQVQDMIADQKKRYGKYQRREQPVQFMLKGLVRCGNCGATLVYIGTKYPAMQCHQYARGVCKVSHSLSISKANRVVIDKIEETLKTLDFNIIYKTQNNPQENIDYDKLIKQEKEKIRRASEAYDAGFDTLEEYGIKKRTYQSRISEYESAKIQQPKKKNDTIPNEFLEKCQNVLKIIKSPEADEAAKNEALRTIIDHITYEKEDNNLAIYFYL